MYMLPILVTGIIVIGLWLTLIKKLFDKIDKGDSQKGIEYKRERIIHDSLEEVKG